MSADIRHGDCLEVLAAMPDNSVDAIVTDPPYGLGFMGKAWDDLPPGLPWAQECLRVLKPGGHLLAFGGTRTWHRLACAVEDAGFEMRDSIAWLYGSGFPKSHDVSKAIDKAAGAEREVVGRYQPPSGQAWNLANDVSRPGGGGATLDGGTPRLRSESMNITAPATEAAQQWQGWGTALKPGFEPVVVARKPLVGTVAQNVLTYGTGAINVDATRIGTDESLGRTNHTTSKFIDSANGSREAHARTVTVDNSGGLGRWPANVVLDEDQAAALDQQSGTVGGGFGIRGGGGGGNWNPTDRSSSAGQTVRGDGRQIGYGDSGGASRFFYVAKAPKSERPVVDGIAHPTVKPLALMRWLVRLVTPPGGTVLDPFAGSGTTVEAAILEGFDVIGIEREADYLALIHARIERASGPRCEWRTTERCTYPAGHAGPCSMPFVEPDPAEPVNLTAAADEWPADLFDGPAA